MKGVNQRRFADPRLPGNEGDLPFALQRSAQAIPQFTERSLSSHQVAGRRPPLHGGLLYPALAVCTDEPVPAPGQRFDEPWTLRMISQNAPDMQDLALEAFGLNVRIGPHGVEQVVLRDQPAGALNQMPQDSIRLGRQQDALFIS